MVPFYSPQSVHHIVYKYSIISKSKPLAVESNGIFVYCVRDAVSEEGAPAMGAKALCIPFKQPAEMKSTDKCICPDCANKPQMYTLFGRSY